MYVIREGSAPLFFSFPNSAFHTPVYLEAIKFITLLSPEVFISLILSVLLERLAAF